MQGRSINLLQSDNPLNEDKGQASKGNLRICREKISSHHSMMLPLSYYLYEVVSREINQNEVHTTQ